MLRPVVVAVLLTIASLAAYWPIRHAGFTNFDDPIYVTNNPKVFHGLTADGFVWAFTSFHGSNWHPLTWLSHMLDCQVFGEKAAGHHWVSVGFHVANTLLLFLLLRQMTGSVWRSAFVAALFALHPLHVESVAWVAERKDVLSTFFGLLALWAYGRYAEAQSLKSRVQSRQAGLAPRSSGHSAQPSAEAAKDHAAPPTFRVSRFTHHPAFYYILSLSFFVLGLMSKPMLVTLPFVMFLLDYWPLRRFGPGTKHSKLGALRRLLTEKLPFFLLAAASCAVTFIAQKTGGAVVPMEAMPFTDRVANASISYLGYLIKTLWPVRLAAFYPFAPEWTAAGTILSLLVLAGVTALALAAVRRAPFVLVGWLWFVGTLIPVIGLVQVGSQAMADRYTYFPLIGVFVAIVWGTAALTSRWRYQRLALGLAGAGVLVACFACTWVQVGYWQNSITLFSRAIRVTKDNALAQHNLGHALSVKGNQAEAIRHFDEALRIKPGYPQAHFNRGNAYGVLGDVDRAIADYREAIRHKPDYEQAYCNLGMALALQDKLDEARTNFLAALRCKPDYAEAHTKLGNVLLLQGAVLEAMPHLYQAVKIRPDYDEGQYFLGEALACQKQFAEAAAAFRAAIRAKPDYALALNDLAWLLATQTDAHLRDVTQAVHFARRACELTQYADPKCLDTLGVALAEAGHLKEATSWTEKALTLATEAGDAPVVAELQKRLAAYRAGQSYTRSRSAPPVPTGTEHAEH